MNLFIKKIKYDNGKIIIVNQAEYLKFLEKYIEKISDSKNNEELFDNKRKCIADFLEIYRYDIEKQIYPKTLYGFYKNKEDYEKTYSKKVLIEEFSNFLGTIFLNYHIKRYNKSYKVPIYGYKQTVNNSLELYSKMICDYYRVLYEYNGVYRLLKTGQLYGNPYENYNNEVKDEDFINFSDKNHALVASFIAPSLIEETLKSFLQNRVITEMFCKISKESCKSKEEKIRYRAIEIFLKRKSFCGNKYDVLINFYNLFVQKGIIKEDDEYKAIITGYNNKMNEITLGYLLNVKFIDKYIQNEYLQILKLLYGTKNLNLRNSIMHGNDENFDIYNINLLAVQIQVLWDICENEIFK